MTHPDDDAPLPREPSPPSAPSDRARRRAIERFEEAHSRVSSAALRIGQSQHRDVKGFELFNLHAEIEREIATLRDVFERFPDVHDALLEIRRLNEQIGLERRLDADRFAIELNRAIRGAMIQHDQLVGLLLWREPTEIDFIAQAFRDRYGVPLPQAVERASRSWHARILNLIVRRDLDLESERVRLLVAKKRDEALAVSIYLALRWRWGHDVEALRQIYRRHSVEDIAPVEALYRERFAGEFGAETMDEALQEQLPPKHFSMLHALRWDQFARAEAMRLRQMLRKKRPDLDQVARVIRELTSPERKELRRAWRQLYGDKLREYVSPRLSPKIRNALTDFLIALLGGRMNAAASAQLRLAFLGYPGAWVGDAFVGQSDQDRADIVRLFERRYSVTFDAELRRHYRDLTNRELMRSLVQHGKLGPADLLRDCMHGFGTDEEGIIRILMETPRAELPQVEEEYRKFTRWDFIEGFRPRPIRFLRHFFATLRESFGRGKADPEAKGSRKNRFPFWPQNWARFGRGGSVETGGVLVSTLRISAVSTRPKMARSCEARMGTDSCADPKDLGFWARFRRRAETRRDLWSDLATELDGDDWRDALALRHGRPETLDELYQFTIDRYDREIEGPFSGIVHRVSREGTALDRDIRQAREYYESQIRGRNPGEHQERRLRTLLAYANHAFDSFRDTKHTVAFVAANLISGGAVTLTVALVVRFDRPLPWVMAGAFLASASTRVLCRFLVAARGYGREKMVQDLTLATIDGATLAMGTLARRFLGPIGRRLLRSSLSQKFVKASSSFVLKRLVQTGRELDAKKKSRHLDREVDPFGRASLDVNQILERLSLYT